MLGELVALPGEGGVEEVKGFAGSGGGFKEGMAVALPLARSRVAMKRPMNMSREPQGLEVAGERNA